MNTTTHATIPVRVYYITFGLLMLLLGATIGAAYVDLKTFNLPLAMLISATKTVLIVLFFMHVHRGNRLIKLVACAGFVWLAIMLTLAMNDYFSRNW